jgi:hypothetical protein
MGRNMTLRRVVIVCLALSACGEVRVVPLGDGGGPEAVAPPSPSPTNDQGGARGVVTTIVTPEWEAGAPSPPPDAQPTQMPAPVADAGPAEAAPAAAEPVDAGSAPDDGPPARTCDPRKTLCDDECVDLQSQRENCGQCGNACAMGQECKSGTCRCKDDQSLCGLGCIPILSDVANCGGCGNVCLPPMKCNNGKCVEH